MPAAAAESGVDTSFGEDGVVHLEPLLSPQYVAVFIRAMAAAPDGESYLLEAGANEVGGNIFLVRYRADGSLDSAFNGPSGALVAENAGRYPAEVAVDGEGRPVVAIAGESGYRIVRLDLTGNPDPSFGKDGSVWIRCRCAVERPGLVLDARGRILVESVAHSFIGRRSTFLARLKSDGAVDRSFGRNGRAYVHISSRAMPALASRANGGIYLSGRGCCGKPKASFLVRVSRRGKLDTRFNARARRSLKSLERLAQRIPFSSQTLVLRPRGRIDLFASSSGDGGLVLRMLPSGKVDRGFAGNGVRTLSMAVTSAALDDGGGTFVVGRESGWAGISHLLPNNLPDPAFGGGRALPLPAPGVDGDLVATQRGGRAMVFDLGFHVCRQSCPATPALFRFVASPAR
ncbi:MAG: hypothetical protein AB7T48_07330 [Solirubrobacterales bacterium]